MIARAVLLIALSCAPLVVVAQAQSQPRSGQNAPKGAGDVAGMVITGDRDAPLVLHIVPWQDPAVAELPRAPRQNIVPVVVDRLRSILEEPVNRPIGQTGKAQR